MSQDLAAFVPPQRYPSPPQNMWFEVPRDKPASPSQQPRSIFPWEGQQPRPSRIFTEAEKPGFTWQTASIDDRLQPQASTTKTSAPGQGGGDDQPPTPTIKISSPDSWDAFTRTNAWDDMPEIELYVHGLHTHRSSADQKSSGISSAKKVAQERGLRLTDFPTAVERPSLPVTPAPVRRSKFWSGASAGVAGELSGEGVLPAAEGVPPQRDWVCVHGNQWAPTDCLCDLTNVLRYHKDPVAQLQKLAKQQSEALLKKLADSSETSAGDNNFGAQQHSPTSP